MIGSSSLGSVPLATNAPSDGSGGIVPAFKAAWAAFCNVILQPGR